MKIGVITELYAYGEGTGTFDFLKLVLRGIESQPNNQVFLFFRSDEQLDRLRRLPVWLIKLVERFIPKSRNSQIPTFSEFKKATVVDYKLYELNDIIKTNNIDVIFPSMIDLGKNVSVKWCGNLWDCQHQYYPQYFSWYMRIYRNWYFKRMLTNSAAVIVNSENAKADFCKFYKVGPDKIKALPLLPTMDHSLMGDDDESVLEKYGLDKPYFLISNRFWKHKSHDTAIKAIGELVNKRHYDVYLVCTGKMSDYRDKKDSHINYLYSLIEDLGLKNNIKLPGLVPKKDQIEMMKRAIGVIQPSKFEGDCSGQIIDAITIGQRSICSDIEVLKEVSYTGNICYFRLDDVNDLADKMEDYIKTPYQRPSYEELLVQEQKYLTRFSNAINQILSQLTA